MPSTAIRSFAYDQAISALDVTFTTGRRYRYFMVPAYVAEGLSEAFSKGRYFNTRVRDRFPFEELAPEAKAKAKAAPATSRGKGTRRRP